MLDCYRIMELWMMGVRGTQLAASVEAMEVAGEELS